MTFLITWDGRAIDQAAQFLSISDGLLPQEPDRLPVGRRTTLPVDRRAERKKAAHALVHEMPAQGHSRRALARHLGCLQTTASAPVTFVVTGEDGSAAEDLACAEYIGRRAAGGEVQAAPCLHRARRSRAAADLAEGLRRGYRGVHQDDVGLCLEVDRFSFAMVARQEDSLTVLRPVAVPDDSAASADLLEL